MEAKLHTNAGVDEKSYTNNSSLQRKVISLTAPIIEEAASKLFSDAFPRTITIADLGCSSGSNTLFLISKITDVIHMKSRKLGQKSPELLVFLNDLPYNDFNTLFQLLPSFQEHVREQLGINCFIAGVPNSFYGRLFLAESMDMFLSSYSLMWLSKVPRGLEENKGNIYISSGSPLSVVKAYSEQFRADFGNFVKCRAEELVVGGRMVFTALGRSNDDPKSKDNGYVFTLLAIVLNEFVSEGLIEESKLYSFNVPIYYPSPNDLKCEIEKEGSFIIEHLEISHIHWSGNDYNESLRFPDEVEEMGHKVSNLLRAVCECVLVNSFGEEIIDELFRRYREIVIDYMSNEPFENHKFTNLTLSLIKKG